MHLHQKLAKSITQWFAIPTVCVLCQHQHSRPLAICTSCTARLTRLEHPCQYCNLPLPNADFPVCGQCLREKPAFDRVLTHYCYTEPLRTILHQYKYVNALHLRTFLVQLMLEAFDQNAAKADCIMPIPLHRKRMQQRGFNQAAELAKLLSKNTHIPYDATVCKKITNTAPQVGLTAKQRQTNLRHSFMAKSSPYEHVLLIDDLITTGSTANEMARTLKQQGVKRVDVWCCARAN